MSLKNIALSAILIGVVGYAQSLSVNDKWQLLGATEDINISSFNNTCAKFIWKYDSNDNTHPWKLYSTDGNSHNYPYTMSSIKKTEGFWILGKDDTKCNIDTSNEQNYSSFDARHLGGITVYEVYFDDGAKSIGKLEFLDDTTVKYTAIEGEDAGESATIKFTATQNSITTVSIDGSSNLSDEDASTTTFTEVLGKPYFLKGYWKARNGDEDINYYFHTLKEAKAFTYNQI